MDKMKKSIYDNLFNDEIVWGLHTTYNCDMAYSAELLLKQCKENAIGNIFKEDGFAVFYNKSCGLSSKSEETDAKRFKDKFFFSLENEAKQTFHAKISLIKYKADGKDGYRIAVYSKNHSYGGKCAEFGEIFELKKPESVNTSINMLCCYLDALYKGSSEEGKQWLKGKKLVDRKLVEGEKDNEGYEDEDYECLKECRAFDAYGNEVDLFFGGCEDKAGYKALGDYLEMSKICFDESIIITPPEFIRKSDDCRDFFKSKKCLYDLKQERKQDGKPERREYNSSHGKLYLIKKNDETYHLFFGSANATPHGLGVSFPHGLEDWKPISQEKASIECLAHRKIERDDFEKIKKGIEKYYKVFDFKEGEEGSLRLIENDPFAQDFAQHCKAEITDIKFPEDNSGKSTTTIKFKLSPRDSINTNTLAEKKYEENDDDFSFIPAEYKGKKENYLNVGEVWSALLSDKKEFCFQMEVDSYYPIKGTAYVNDNVIMDLDVPSDDLKGYMETKPPAYSITLVSDWLLGKRPSREKYKDEKLQWFRDLCVDGSTSVSIGTDSNAHNPAASSSSAASNATPLDVMLETTVELETKQMQFQKDGTQALLNILETNSRAFLADEAGLGKTYTATGVMDTLYDQFYKDVNNADRPFYVFYIAPNIPLLSKNCRDIVKKSKHSEDIIDLGNIRSELPRIISMALNQRLLKGRVKYDRKGCIVRGPDGRIVRERRADPQYANAISKEYERLVNDKFNKCDKPDGNTMRSELYSKSATEKFYKKLNEFSGRVKSLEKEGLSKYLCQYELVDIVKEQQLSEIFETGFKTIDRIACIKKYLELNAKLLKKKIVLLPISAELILDGGGENGSGSELEKKLRQEIVLEDGRKIDGTKRLRCQIKEQKEYTRKEMTKMFLEEFSPNMIIWDEYHRYMNKMDEKQNVFMQWEKNFLTKSPKSLTKPIPFKALYLSATPYLSNKSDVDSEAEKRYDDWNNEDSKEAIPAFEDFAKLFVGGYSEDKDNITEKQLINSYNSFTQDGEKTDLEKELRRRMVRHERARLQNAYEQHKVLFDNDDKYKDEELKEVFLKTKKRIEKMKEAGFGDGTAFQALNMPYFGSFTYKNKNGNKKNNNKKVENTYAVIKSLKDRKKLDPSLFLPDTLEALPKEALAIKQLIDVNIKDDRSSLLWIPPTNELYDPGKDSIYSKYRKYSKTLVFAETIFYQRGYAYLLSRYTDEVANRIPLDSNKTAKKLELDYTKKEDVLNDICNLCNPWEFELKYKGLDLDGILEKIIENDKGAASYKDKYKRALASIAAPAVCAKRLGLEASKVEECFNGYFYRPGIINALLHWADEWIEKNQSLVDKLGREDIYEIALLRYCAEGNLLAVLEEWIFVLNESNPVELCDRFEQVLVNTGTKKSTTVFPVSETRFKNHQDADNSLRKECTFAERLVGDYLDVGSGEDAEVKGNLSARFSSPFWPMIMIAGRGAQEGMDYHEYCLRMMHLTLPPGPVSFEQRQGRIDRFRGLLVRRRVGKYFEDLNVSFGDTKKDLLKRQYEYLLEHKPADNELYANYNMPEDGENYFERLMPFWDYSEEARERHILERRLESYRSSLGIYETIDDAIDLSAKSILMENACNLGHGMV